MYPAGQSKKKKRKEKKKNVHKTDLIIQAIIKF